MDFSPKASEVRRIGLVKEVDISAVDPQVKEGYELFVQQLSRDFDVMEVSIRHWKKLLLLITSLHLLKPPPILPAMTV